MDNILILISVLCLGKSVIMTNLLPKMWHRFVFSLLCVLSIWLFYPYAIETNKINVENMLLQQDRMLDMTLFFVIDLLLSIGFCWVVFARWNNRTTGKYTVLLSYIPSLLVFPVIFYLQLNLSFLFVGTSFLLLTGIYSGLIFVFIFCGAYIVGKLLPETALRLELVIVFSGLLFALIICCTVFHPSARIFSQSTAINFKELYFSFLIIALIFISGVFMPRIYKHFKK
ncbi:MAG: hypothetical protein LBE13_15340 [Bacteroidales bacterium]|jgi:hypothetical protein|nr:hypothetical protein [Bacteroidales bacterium]